MNEIVYQLGLAIFRTLFFYYSYHFARKRPELLSILCVLIITLLPFAVAVAQDWFIPMKAFSMVFFLSVLLIVYRREKIGKKYNVRFFSLFLVLAFSIDILEALVKDVQIGFYFNAMTAFLLIFFLLGFTEVDQWKFIRSKNNSTDLVMDIPFGWQLLYTTWNLCFVYTFEIKYFTCHLAVLLAPLLYVYLHKSYNLWGDARIYTFNVLAFFGLTEIVFHFTYFNQGSFHPDLLIANYWGALNLGITVLYIIRAFHKRGNARKNSVYALICSQ